MDHGDTQRMLLSELLHAHPRMLDAADLCERYARFPDAQSALRALMDDGLATQLGDLVGASRAAVRFEALRP